MTPRLVSLRSFAAVVLSALVLPLAVSGAQAAPADTAVVSKPKASKPATVTSKPKVVPASAPEISNPLRGQYRWMGYGLQPETWTGNDVYYRDQIYWGRIEPADNVFDFSFIDDGIRDAEARGGTFNLRVMSYCPDCWMTFRTDRPPVTPPFVPTVNGVPDWNSPEFIAQWEALMAELGRRYGSNSRIGIVDVGGYGKYGEYWTNAATEGRISVANSQRVVGAVVNAFPDAHVVINTMDPTLVLPAVKKFPRLGLRTDCLGAFNMFSIIPVYEELQDVWKRAPVISEWCHSSDGSTTLGAQQVRDYHVSMVSSQNFYTPYADMTPAQQAGWVDAAKSAGYRYAVSSVTHPKVLKRGKKSPLKAVWRNAGSAPTYDGWKPYLGLANASGAIVWETKWNVPLKRTLPGKTAVTRKVRVPRAVRAGRYTLVATVRHPDPGYAPMGLANEGRDGNGWYPLTSVKVK